MNNPESKKYVKFVFTFFAIGLLFCAGFFLGRASMPYGINFSGDTIFTGDLSGDVTGINVDILWEAWNQLEKNHLDTNLDKQKLLYGAIKGIIDSLDDDYSQFLTPQETSTYNETSGSKFEGIGAILRFDGEYTIIDTPIDGFPAQKSGLMPGDVIFYVDDKDVRGMPSAEVAELIKGPSGSSVKISIFRPKDQKELAFTIQRESIDIDNVSLEKVEDGIAHLKITKFNESDSQEFIRQWDSIIDDIVGKGVNSVILDLRNNPGGLVQLVKYVSEEFLDKGDLIMIEQERDGTKEQFVSSRDGRLRDKKIVILVNEGSASASEILAGALVDNDRAEVVGMPTVGKGVEQKLVTLSDGSTMHIVFRRWLTPSGRQVTKEDPITPDHEVELTTEDFEANRDPQLEKAYEIIKK